ncbi:hypothetical protein ACGGAQ_22950 [Micromonospora sp. NPDC047557]|uniref:hypothetical protein n=1 Tax=Micromonospora sp. NPDC047557 TaxID=3364250 RepID=UPI0037109A61
MPSVDCPSLINIAVISGYYSQMSGVLAGFAFTAMVFLLRPAKRTRREGRKRRAGGELLALFAAFVALVITTLIYSVLAGETDIDARPRAATASIVNGVVFGLAVIMLFQGVTLLMQRSAVDRAVVATARFVTVVAVPALAYNYVVNGTSDVVAARAAKVGPCEPSLSGMGLILTAALAAVLAVSLTPIAQRAAWRKYSPQFQVAAPITVLVVSVIVAIVSGDITVRSPEFLPSPTVTNAFLVGYFILLALLGFMLSCGDVPQEDVHETASRVGPGSDEPGQASPGRGEAARRQRKQRQPPAAGDTGQQSGHGQRHRRVSDGTQR